MVSGCIFPFLFTYMTINESQLAVKKSSLPNSGKGLFSKVFIPKGTYVVEYKGSISKWKELEDSEWDNGYIYFVNNNYVINARPHPEALARYANDARGLVKIKGLSNNCVYKKKGGKIYIYAEKDIHPGQEILVSYGKEYWQTVRTNMKIVEKQKARD